MAITKKQKEVLDIIKKNPTATLQEIAYTLGKKSVGNIHKHIENLKEQGILIKNSRQYIVKEENSPITYVPFYGYAQCGYNDILQESNVKDYIPLPTYFLPSLTNDLFLIKAKGDSMDPTIKEDSLVLFRKNSNNGFPDNGKIVLAYYGEGLKIKRFNLYKENAQTTFRLISDNKTQFEPIEIDPNDETLQIVGTYVGTFDIEEKQR